jgi:polysaccharide export outer membrane protein
MISSGWFTHGVRFGGVALVLSLLLRVACLGQSAARLEKFDAPLAPSSRADGTVSASSTVAYTTSMEVLDNRRRLGVGDRVSLRVVEDRKPPVDLVVTDSGEMEVPLVGRVPANDKTCKQLAFEIKRLLEKDYFYTCNVIVGLDSVSTKSRGRVYIMGQVRSQGALEIPFDEKFTVSKAVLRAGGLADFANKKKVKVVREKDGKTQTIFVDLAQVLDRGRIEKDVELLPNDLVVVPERLINF